MKNLNVIREIHDKLGSPFDKFKIVHVGGTNGKGTVSLNIAKGLEKAGYKTGLFSSPHFHSLHERISINGENISEEDLQRIYKENKEQFNDLMFFELMTLIAAVYFAEQKIDFAVIEVGMGGLHDTTNIITPQLSVITNISNDHANFLGGSLSSIAENKAGIIKEKTPVVLGYHAKFKECLNKAKEKKAPLYLIDKEEEDYLKENKAIADKALSILGVEALEKIYTPPARFEVHGNMVFDMAHNEAAFLALKKKVQTKYPNKKIIALWNMTDLKDVTSCLHILQSFASEVFFYPYDNYRLLTEEKAKELGLKTYSNETADVILACGSAYFLADAKRHLL